jgi:alkylation response protein AidB-like acyl-CoA dehydrogenase
MYFDLDDDQRALQDAVRELAEDRFPIERTRTWAEPAGPGTGIDRAAWTELAELGTFTLTLPEDRGGLDLPTVNAVLVFQTLGAALVPGPLVPAALGAELPGELGEQIGAGALLPALAIQPEPGLPLLVEHLDGADVLLVLTPEGISRVDPARVVASPVEHPLDPTTPLSLVSSLPAGEPIGDAAAAARWYRLGSLLSSALLAGNALRTTDLAVAFAKQREQFGRVIGGFQAIKHLLADSFARGEVARAAVDSAGVLVDDPAAASPGSVPDGAPAGLDGPDPAGRAVASARVLAAEAAVMNAKTAVQVHGGMGFTWEVDIHLYLKRAWLLETAFTTPDAAAEAVADSLQGV